MKLTSEISEINQIKEIIYAYIIQHNKKYDHYFIKCEFKKVFSDNQDCPYVTSNSSDIKTMFSRSFF